MTWEALPERAEVWPLSGRGIQHIRIRVNRDAMLPYGARIDEVGSVDAGSVGQSLSFPSSPSVPSPPVNNSSSRAAPSVSSPALEIDGGGQRGQETGEVETTDPGEDDEIESIVPGGHDEVESIGPEG